MIVSARRVGVLAAAGLWHAMAFGAVPPNPPQISPSANEPITPIVAPPAGNPLRVALGEALFSDRRLSRDGSQSCLSCHDLSTNGASANAIDEHAFGADMLFNTPTVFNATLNFRLNWEGNYRSLDTQNDALLRSPHIMATTGSDIVSRLSADPSMRKRFRAAYGGGIDRATLLDALGSFERTLVTPDSPFDRWLRGDVHAISAEALDGYGLFKTMGCAACHQGENVGGNLYERRGIFSPLASPLPETVRVPSLRNVAVTPPYFHDGSAPDLVTAVQDMAVAQLGRSLSDQQVRHIVAFLNTLTGHYGGRELVRPDAARLPGHLSHATPANGGS